jgi:hypothetical protein
VQKPQNFSPAALIPLIKPNYTVQKPQFFFACGANSPYKTQLYSAKSSKFSACGGLIPLTKSNSKVQKPQNFPPAAS